MTAETRPQTASPGEKGNVLLMDDDKFLVDMYSMKFEASGYRMQACLSVAEALEALRAGARLRRGGAKTPGLFLPGGAPEGRPDAGRGLDRAHQPGRRSGKGESGEPRRRSVHREGEHDPLRGRCGGGGRDRKKENVGNKSTIYYSYGHRLRLDTQEVRQRPFARGRERPPPLRGG